jgi:hypothetical protein
LLQALARAIDAGVVKLGFEYAKLVGKQGHGRFNLNEGDKGCR